MIINCFQIYQNTINIDNDRTKEIFQLLELINSQKIPIIMLLLSPSEYRGIFEYIQYLKKISSYDIIQKYIKCISAYDTDKYNISYLKRPTNIIMVLFINKNNMSQSTNIKDSQTFINCTFNEEIEIMSIVEADYFTFREKGIPLWNFQNLIPVYPIKHPQNTTYCNNYYYLMDICTKNKNAFQYIKIIDNEDNFKLFITINNFYKTFPRKINSKNTLAEFFEKYKIIEHSHIIKLQFDKIIPTYIHTKKDAYDYLYLIYDIDFDKYMDDSNWISNLNLNNLEKFNKLKKKFCKK